MATALHILGVFFLICGGAALFSEDPDDISAGIIFLLLCAGCFFLSHYLENRPEGQDSKATENELNHARGNAMNATSKINHDYALGLTEVDLLDVAYSEHPFDMIAQKITPGYPTVPDFLHNTNRMITLLSEEMNMSTEQCANITFSFIHEIIPSVTNEAIQEIADNFSAQLPRELYFLKNKINYELSTLGMIMSIAQQTNDHDLQRKVQTLRKKRGYI